MSITGLARVALVLAIAALTFGLTVALIYVLGMVRSAVVIVVASVFLAYAIAPVVTFFRRRTPLAVAVTLAYLTLLAIVVIFFFVVAPPVVAQARLFAASLPDILAKTFKAIDNSGILNRLPPSVDDYLNSLPLQVTKAATSYGPALAQQGLGFVLSFASVAISLVVVPILSAYLLFDAADLRRAVLGFVPAEYRSKALAVIADLNDVTGGFIRGQMLDGLIVGILIWGMLALNHVPFALLIGVAAGVLNLVPYLGAIVGFVPSVLLALAYNGWQSALIVALLFAVIQQVDGNLIVPRIMQANVSLSPVILVVSIIVFAGLFGVLGTFIAVPVAAMLRVVKLHFAPAPPEDELARDLTLALPQRRFR